jgi:DNA adenine methylase
VKWAGGKTQLLEKLLSRMPERFGTYFEPMVGGGALLFGLITEMLVTKCVIADTNADLINVYTTIREDVETLIEHLGNMALDPKANTRKYFEAVRAKDPANMHSTEAAARFMYLNRCCFNGLYRVNKSGKFNVPFGDYKNPKICDGENLIDVCNALQNVDIYCEGFHRVLERAREDDLVYFDPPYIPVSETSDFVSFTRDGFDEVDHQVLANVFEKLGERGVYCMLSNSDTPYARQLYDGFDIDLVLARRNINKDGRKRGKVGELIVRNY